MKTAAILLLFIASSESSFSKRWNTVRPGNPAYVPRVGKSFFACNEVARVKPSPNSLLTCVQQTGIYFQRRWWSPNVKQLAESITPSGRHGVFLVPDPLKYDIRLHPYDLSFADSHGKVLSALFDFKAASGDLTALRRSMRTLFLVVDGGWYYSPVEEFLFPYHAYVPLSVFGEYFLVEEEMKGRVRAPLPRSYCQDPISPRRVGRPPTDEVDHAPHVTDSLRIEIDPNGLHYLERNQDSNTAQISLLAYGWGKASMVLPPTVDVLFEGKRVTVALPDGQINMERGYGQVHIPVKRELVYDLRERVYHYASPKMVPLSYQPTFYKQDKHFPSYTLIRGESVARGGAKMRSSCVEFYDPSTQLKIVEYIALESNEDHAPNILNKTDYVLLKHMEDIDWRRQLVSSRTASAFSPHHFEGYGHQTVFPTKNDYTECRRCPPNSRRSVGRAGMVHHCAELGTFYNLLTAMDSSQWTASHTLNLTVTLGGPGQSTYLTAPDRIPSALKEAVRKYGVLVPPLGPWGYPGKRGTEDPVIYHDLEEAIYVPIDVVHKHGCGGLRLYRHPKNFSTIPDFCERDFGDCIGEPFHSPKRFPVVPPFGLTELAGPVPTHQWSQLSPKQMSPLIGVHPSPGGGHMAPRAVLKLTDHRREGGTMILSYSPQQVSIGHVSVPVVKLLEPVLAFRPWQHVALKTSEVVEEKDFCSSVWKLQSLLHNASHQTEAILSASALNTGEGGGTVVFEAKCTSQLIIIPSSGKQMVWVPPHSEATVSFSLNAIKTSNFIAVHTCHLSVTMETVSSFSNHHPAPLCTKKIRTFGGAFEDPCSAQMTTPPNVQLLYYILPPDQRKSSAVALRQFLTSPAGRGLTVIRAVTLVLSASKEDERTLLSLYEERVSCGHHDVTVVGEDQLFHEALLSRRSPDRKPPNNITINSNFLLPRRVFYFGGRDWAQDQGSKHAKPSGCHVEVWVRTRPFPCKHIEKSLDVFIPLSTRDAEVIQTRALTSGKDWFLTMVYGDQQEVLVAMTTLVLCTIIVVAFIGAGQGMMCLFRNSIPTQGTLRYLERRLDEARRNEKRKWENPEIFLSSDQQGPFYRLYDFRATDSFDTLSLRRLRIAGTLKYKGSTSSNGHGGSGLHQDRQLQVLFGHVTKVYVDDTKMSRDLWVEASSGMYLLEYSNVDPEYKDILTEYLTKHGIACP